MKEEKKKKNEEEKEATPPPTPTGSDTPHHAMRVEAFLREKYDELWGPNYDDPHADEAEDTYNRYDRFCW